MIGETGSPATSQASYLEGVEQQLPTDFPQVRAVAYFDAAGPAADWSLTPAGLTALGRLASNPSFSAMPGADRVR
ncbi:MAG TPA: hypothetical protein VHZ05_01120 [Acidimicrobiales bacterium]|nr:hypothetical protein [Acidimicrobiales bacterium]